MTTESKPPKRSPGKPRNPKPPVIEQEPEPEGPDYVELTERKQMLLEKAVEITTSFCPGIGMLHDGESWQNRAADEDLDDLVKFARERCVVAAFNLLTNEFGAEIK